MSLKQQNWLAVNQFWIGLERLILETSTLRWIIIIIGILVLGSIFLFGHPEKKRKPRASRRQENQKAQRLEPTLNSPDKADDLEVADGGYSITGHGGSAESGSGVEFGQGELDIGGVQPDLGESVPGGPG